MSSIEIKTHPIRDCRVTVPGSKSFSHRILIASALSNGVCTIDNCLDSEDTHLTRKALLEFGVAIDDQGDRLIVKGRNGSFKRCDRPVFLGNSGTSMRLLTALSALGKGTYTLTGTKRMQARPLNDLLDGLGQIGVRARSLKKNGCPPVEVVGGKVRGGSMKLRCGTSSQFLSAILLIAPLTLGGVEIEVIEGPVSKPYIDMTLDVMACFGVQTVRSGYTHFRIDGGQTYESGSHTVEPDLSQAGYFWGAAAVTGSRIKVQGASLNSRQGDVRLLGVLESMGCRVVEEADGIALVGGELKAVEADMSNMPDMVPTLAVVSAFAKGTTRIKNVAHLRVKESDRLASVADGLTRMGVSATCTDDGLIIAGGNPRGSEIDTFDDHRIAMSFALAGLVVSGVVIQNKRCVEKSFPNFWEVFEGLYK